VACFPARAVAGCSICCLPKETTIVLHIKMMPMWDEKGGNSDQIRGGRTSCVARRFDSFTAQPLSASRPRRPVAPGSAA
jgi:hypothetical protein